MQNLMIGVPTRPENCLVSFQFQASDQFPLLHVEQQVQSLLGWSASELINMEQNWLELVHSDYRHTLQSQIHLLSDGQSIQYDYLIKNSQKSYQWVRSQFFSLPAQTTILATWFDLSQTKQFEVQEVRYTNLLESIIEASHSLFYPAELELGMSQILAKIGSVTQVDRVYFLGTESPSESPSLSKKFPKTLTPSNFFAWGRQGTYSDTSEHWLKQSFPHSHHHPIWQHLLQGESLAGSVENMPAEISTCLQEHQVESILLLPILQNKRFLGVLGFETSQSSQTWTEREINILEQLTITLGVALKQFHVESRLSHYAFHDPLTELPNRALLLNRLEHCIGRQARQTTYSFAVLFLDLDRFKPVNDRLGHDIGDRLLVQVAQRLSNLVRPGDTVARLGGDEFVILLDDVATIPQAESAIKRLRAEITRSFLIDGNEIHIDTSVGIALSSMEQNSAEAILQKADLAMYRAKNAGKGCYRIFEHSMHSQMMLKSDTEFSMHLALERQEFEVHYQPIISLNSGKIKGFEALARWNHPDMGLLDPSHFIPIAEETGLINSLGLQILHMACEQAKQWQDTIPASQNLTINVNLSAKQLAQKSLVQNITSILEKTRIPPSCLHLELTESFVIRKDSATLTLMNQLQALGIKIYLDDFGAGYSSLQYLNFFPINGLKIDRMFTQKIATHPETKAIVRSIIIMAQALNMNLVVEGIENHQQIDYLNQFQDIDGQGFLFSRPLSSERAQSLLMSQESLTAPSSAPN